MFTLLSQGLCLDYNLLWANGFQREVWIPQESLKVKDTRDRKSGFKNMYLFIRTYSRRGKNSTWMQGKCF